MALDPTDRKGGPGFQDSRPNPSACTAWPHWHVACATWLANPLGLAVTPPLHANTPIGSAPFARRNGVRLLPVLSNDAQEGLGVFPNRTYSKRCMCLGCDRALQATRRGEGGTEELCSNTQLSPTGREVLGTSQPSSHITKATSTT